MVKGMQQPRATLRISGELYQELVAIAEARDCTLQQALDFYLERVRQQAVEEARQTELKGMPEPRRRRKAKAKAKPTPEPKPRKTPVKLIECPECGRKVKECNLGSHRERVHRVKS